MKLTQDAHMRPGYQHEPNVHESTKHALSVPYVQPSLDVTKSMELQIKEEASGSFYNIMQRQNEITAALVQQQRTLSLPAKDILVFDGNSLQYRACI